MPQYDFSCPHCGKTKEIIQSITKTLPKPRCKCGKQMKQTITGGTARFMGATTLGSLSDVNTDRMSLDQKIAISTAKFSELNPLIKRELAEQDRTKNIEREIKAVTKGHNR